MAEETDSSAPRVSRRAILFAIGGVTVAGSVAGASLAVLRKAPRRPVPSALPVGTAIAAASVSPAQANATPSPVTTTLAVTFPAGPATAVSSARATDTPRPRPTDTPRPVPTDTPRPLPTDTPRPPTPTPPPPLATLTDSHGRVRLSYPANWQATLDVDPTTIIEVTGDGSDVSVTAYVNSSNSPVQQLQDIAQHRRHDRTYQDESPQGTSVGGESGASMRYRSTAQNNPADVHEGMFWIVRHSNALYQIEGFVVGTFTGDAAQRINGVVASIAFL